MDEANSSFLPGGPGRKAPRLRNCNGMSPKALESIGVERNLRQVGYRAGALSQRAGPKTLVGYFKPKAMTWPSWVATNTLPRATTGSLKCTQSVRVFLLFHSSLPLTAS